MNKLSLQSSGRNAWLASVAGVLLAGAAAHGQCLTNNVTNIIWRVDMQATIARQDYDPNVIPVVDTAKIRTVNFLEFLLGRAPDEGEVLALNIDLIEGTTNVYLSVFDTQESANTALVSVPSNPLTSVLIDCTNLSFAVEAPLPALTNVFSGSRWLGGSLQLAGTGKLGANGVAPIRVKANVNGYIVDERPTDLVGTTATVTKATIKIRGKPLRVQPPIVP